MKKQKSRASLLPISELPETSFKLIQDRDEFIIKKRFEGHTLQEIGTSVGLTRERIRQIVQIKNGPNTETISKIRLAKYKKEIIEFIKKNPDFNRAELAKEIEISLEQLKKFLGREFKHLASNSEEDIKKKYTDSELIQILRNSKLDPNGILSAANFLRNGGKPTIAVFISRFGSWKNACNLAGVQTGEGRKSYNREHSKLELLAFVEQYLNEAESSGSADGYDKWQRNFPNAPSLALLRQRLGKWNDIKKQLSRFI
jgi:hypothetical protein